VGVKDYIDIYALMTKSGVPLANMLAAASVIFGPQVVNPLDALKAIAYHQDPLLAGLSEEVRRDLAKVVQATDPENPPTLKPIRMWQDGT
jgi:hypothetical protein